MELLSTDGFHETLERAIGEVAEPFLVVDKKKKIKKKKINIKKKYKKKKKNTM